VKTPKGLGINWKKFSQSELLKSNIERILSSHPKKAAKIDEVIDNLKEIKKLGLDIDNIVNNPQDPLIFYIPLKLFVARIRKLKDLGVNFALQDMKGDTILHKFLNPALKVNTFKSIAEAIGFDKIKCQNNNGLTVENILNDLITHCKNSQKINELCMMKIELDKFLHPSNNDQAIKDNNKYECEAINNIVVPSIIFKDLLNIEASNSSLSDKLFVPKLEGAISEEGLLLPRSTSTDDILFSSQVDSIPFQDDGNYESFSSEEVPSSDNELFLSGKLCFSADLFSNIS
jgi:hypothetical protein